MKVSNSVFLLPRHSIASHKSSGGIEIACDINERKGKCDIKEAIKEINNDGELRQPPVLFMTVIKRILNRMLSNFLMFLVHLVNLNLEVGKQMKIKTFTNIKEFINEVRQAIHKLEIKEFLNGLIHNTAIVTLWGCILLLGIYEVSGSYKLNIGDFVTNLFWTLLSFEPKAFLIKLCFATVVLPLLDWESFKKTYLKFLYVFTLIFFFTVFYSRNTEAFMNFFSKMLPCFYGDYSPKKNPNFYTRVKEYNIFQASSTPVAQNLL